MLDHETAPGENNENAILFLGEDPVKQPSGLICCPLGMQLASPRAIEPDTLIAATLQTRDQDGSSWSVTCRGVVADCRKEPQCRMYQICVVFTDLDPSLRRRLHALSQSHHTLCSYCANF